MEEVKRYTPKPGIVDLKKRVELVGTGVHPAIPKGKVVTPGLVVAEKFKLNGWAK